MKLVPTVASEERIGEYLYEARLIRDQLREALKVKKRKMNDAVQVVQPVYSLPEGMSDRFAKEKGMKYTKEEKQFLLACYGSVRGKGGAALIASIALTLRSADQIKRKLTKFLPKPTTNVSGNAT